MNIFNIEQELLKLFEELENNGGELTLELEEKLAITQDTFKTKVENYTKVIRSTQADISAIDTEIKRLQDYKKTKNNIIERLNKIIINAVDTFGDTTKSGAKFIDYGTGKVLVRNTVKCEVDNDKVDAIAKEYIKCVSFESFLQGASNRENITSEEMIQRCKEHYAEDEDGNMVLWPYEVTAEDLDNTMVEVTMTKPLGYFMNSEGYDLAKSMLNADSSIKVNAKVDKKLLKENISSGDEITIGTLVKNKTITIK